MPDPNMTRDLHPVVDSVLDLVGNTPLLRLTRFAPGLQLFSKLEYLNPGGSVKDRIALAMAPKDAARAIGAIFLYRVVRDCAWRLSRDRCRRGNGCRAASPVDRDQDGRLRSDTNNPAPCARPRRVS